ncbi:MAG: hypothetical protein ACR2II_12515 [Chthoniobacterales bacterium]
MTAEKPADELTGDSDYDEAKDPAKHVALRSAINRLQDVSFFESRQGDSSDPPGRPAMPLREDELWALSVIGNAVISRPGSWKKNTVCSAS